MPTCILSGFRDTLRIPKPKLDFYRSCEIVDKKAQQSLRNSRAACLSKNSESSVCNQELVACAKKKVPGLLTCTLCDYPL